MENWDIQDFMRNHKSYNGNTYKFGITMEGKDYIIKYPKADDLYVFCEYVSSRIICSMGIPCQVVHLGTYKGMLVNVIEDFTSGTDWMLHSFRDTKQSSEDTDIGDKEYTYSDVTYLIQKHLKLDLADKQEAIRRFWQMFLCDAILANRDRHWGNWGYLSDGIHYFPAPIYDNGACLFPNVNRSIGAYSEDTAQFLKDRIYEFPASLLMINRESRRHCGVIRPRRSSYYDVFGNTQIDPILNEERKVFVEKYSTSFFYETVKNVIANINFPLDERIKTFWMSIVPMRFACLVRRDRFESAFAELEERIEGNGNA